MSLSSRLGGAGTPPPPPAETRGGERYRAAGRQPVDQVGEVRLRIQRRLADELGPTLYGSGHGEDLDAKVREVLNDLLAREETPLSGADRARIIREVTDEVLGHGPIESLLRDPSVNEVMVNGPHSVYIERFGRLEKVAAEFDDEQHLRRIIDRICSRVGRRVDEASPTVDARLPDGSRVNAVVPPIALDGPTLTIRKFAAVPLTVGDLLQYGTLTRQAAEFLDACVRGRRNILVSGGTGSGKTTILNILSGFVPADERIVTIEDAAELQLVQDHVVRLESRPPNSEGRGTITTRDLVRNALRMRPDRIVVGEVRDAAALDMLQAMNTGHDGSLTTLHANTPRDAVSRLETMVLMAGMDLPIRAIRDQISSAVDLILQVSRFKDGARKVTHITEVVGMEGDVVTLQDLFVYDAAAGAELPGGSGVLRTTGIRPHFTDTLQMYGVTLPSGMFATRRR
ncbi:type II secretion system protein E [Actinoplanes cyaneus]|uniref:Type II secretion system protein E n=1 Tax=Actinoplanes cyaneus TaxID=52696 RepID=A0A919ICM4_9ACTN|nr:CpaF family protein [Actinoplanes cyaneus]MCW2137567.1 pilus assembly protein CpaF [Actinoplanes cyaneus]GID63615.1 type II secretion system protein E [Actinoplanes cyaneus]